MRKLFLVLLYGGGAGLFSVFFSAPFNYIFAVLFLAGLAVLVFSGRWPQRESALNDMFWLVSFFLWLANIFGLLANGLDFTLGIFLAFSAAFLAFWGGLPRTGGPGATTLLLSSGTHSQDKAINAKDNIEFCNRVVAPGGRKNFVYGFTGALIVAEFFWAAAFLPFGYLTIAGLVFVAFYLIWMISRHYFLQSLNPEVVFRNLTFGAALFAILFLSARWQP